MGEDLPAGFAACFDGATTGTAIEVDMQITASLENGIPGETLDLTVVEGLRQLGIKFEIEIDKQ